ncbi:ABC transporter ATP-binding protein [Paenibacillus yanchengensis]|uniref:ABC transporter ATP-binding protein n=1 Tax=Paenibacillus yanchengensis TaxID=2035833 RepID=A0ABW4YN98_9BACL
MNAVTVHNLCKKMNQFSIQNVSFQVPSGSIVGLIGENGAGKTSTIKLLLNILQKDDGNIIFWEDPNKDFIQVKDQIATVFDQLAFYDKLSAEKINHIMKHIYTSWDSDYYFSLLQQFNLEKKQLLRQFSKGMKMKLNIIIGLAHHPILLILDEPTSGLDPAVRTEILDLFLDYIQNEQNSILFSTHITSDLEKIADYILFMHNGKVLLQENKDHLMHHYGIARCHHQQFTQLPKELIFAYQQKNDIYHVVINDTATFEEAFPDYVLDNLSLDELITISIKGEILP